VFVNIFYLFFQYKLKNHADEIPAQWYDMKAIWQQIQKEATKSY
jgi:hypothetical protein